MAHDSMLAYLLGSYFHQDYLEVTGDERATVGVFLRENPEYPLILADEIRSLLTSGTTETDLNAIASRAGCDINPTYVGETWRDWFASIEAQSRAYAAEHPQP